MTSPRGWIWTPRVYDESYYELSFGDQVHQFDRFEDAKLMLLEELWWLADDLSDEATFWAWEQVLDWEHDGKYPKTIKGGSPKHEYQITKVKCYRMPKAGEDE